jgi:hypothetical protein
MNITEVGFHTASPRSGRLDYFVTMAERHYLWTSNKRMFFKLKLMHKFSISTKLICSEGIGIE